MTRRIETTKVGPFIIYHMKKFRRDAYQYDVMLANEIVFVGETLEQSVKWAERQERLRRRTEYVRSDYKIAMGAWNKYRSGLPSLTYRGRR